jgi:hypothetical protein
MEGNQHIADKKGIFLSLKKYYKKNRENQLDNIPLTFLINNGVKDQSFKTFWQAAEKEKIQESDSEST